MDRYLIGELLPPFLFAFGAFVSLVFTVDNLYELMRKVGYCSQGIYTEVTQGNCICLSHVYIIGDFDDL